MKYSICCLVTCHNRREKTITCINSLYTNIQNSSVHLTVYLLDDGSVDGTKEAVELMFPSIKIFIGDGSYYWAGGMRYLWEQALGKNFDFFLLLNDDTLLFPHFLENLLHCHDYAINKYNVAGIYIGSTKDNVSGKFSYGGRILTNFFSPHFHTVFPNGTPVLIDLGNANIMMVHYSVVDKIGIFNARFTHGIADYEYTFRARKNKIPVLLASEYCGFCVDDHNRNWESANFKLKERIKYLKSPKGLSYKEYLYYIKIIRPFYLPISFVLLWIKTLLPVIWDIFKRKE